MAQQHSSTVENDPKCCPSGHQLPVGQRLCLACGYLLPLSPGDIIGRDYCVEAVFTRAGQRFYEARTKTQAPCLIAESIEFLPESERTYVFAALDKVFPDLIQEFLYYHLASVDFLYVVYSETYCDALKYTLHHQLLDEGLLSETVLRGVITGWEVTLRALRSVNLVLPALHPMLSSFVNEQFWMLNLHQCVLRDSQFVFPQKLEGVHSPFFKLLDQPLNFNEKLFYAAQYSFFATLFSGLDTADFYPEPISLKCYRALFSRDFSAVWHNYSESFDFKHLTLLKQKTIYFQDQNLIACFKTANQSFSRGKAMYHDNHLDQALEHFKQAETKVHVGPQIPRYIALCHRDTYSDVYFEQLDKAIREQNLACLHYEKALGYKATGAFRAALQSLQNALEIQDFYPEAYFEMANIQLFRGNDIRAEQYYRKAIEQRKKPYYVKVLKQFLLSRQRFDSAQELPEFTSTGGRRYVSTDGPPSEIQGYFSYCVQGHRNNLDDARCHVCELPLSLQPGQSLAGYQIEQVMRPRRNHQGEFKGAIYQASCGEQRFFVKEYAVYHRKNGFEDAFGFLKQIAHPQLLPLEDIAVEDGFGYLIFPWVQGVSLGSYLQKHYLIPPAQQVTFFMSLLSLLLYLQESGLVHGDIKPDNILLTSEGPVIVDTDSIMRFQHKSLLRTPVYTFPYSAPEQQSQKLSLTADTYALAVTFIHAFTGIEPSFFYRFDTRSFEGWRTFGLGVDSLIVHWINENTQGAVEKRPLLSRETLQYLFDLRYKQQHHSDPTAQLKVLALYQSLREEKTLRGLEQKSKALLDLSSSSLSLLNTAKAYYRLGQWEPAIQFLKRALKLKPSNVYAAWLMAEIYISRQLYQQAIQAYKLSFDHVGDFFGPYLWSARIWVQLDDLKLATLMFQKALALAPHLPEVALEYAALLIQTRQLESAEDVLRELEKAEGLNPKDRFSLLRLLAQSLSLQQLYHEAMNFLRRALCIRPADHEVRYELALNAFSLKQWDVVQKELAFILEEQEYHPESLFLLSQTYIETHDFEKARDALSALLNTSNWNPVEVRFQLARAYTYLGELDKAQAIYEALLPYTKDPVALFINLANIHVIKKEPEIAKVLFQRAQERAPESEFIRKQLQKLAKLA